MAVMQTPQAAAGVGTSKIQKPETLSNPLPSDQALETGSSAAETDEEEEEDSSEEEEGEEDDDDDEDEEEGSSEASAEDESEDEAIEEDPQLPKKHVEAPPPTDPVLLPQQKVKTDAEDDDIDMADNPTFGDLMQMDSAGLIKVDDQPSSSTALASPRKRNFQTTGGTNSLSNILTQALRTDDADLFSTCFSTKDPDAIRSTVERLESPLATSLLQKLADVLHRKPGRASNLIVWVQWTVVVHGGYLATQPKLMKQLGSLQKVLQQRARALQPLLALKGKLDMLEAQLELRRRMRTNSHRVSNDGEEDDEDVIYVEGENEDDEMDADQDPGSITPSSASLKRIKAAMNGVRSPEPSFDEFEDDAFPTSVNGAAMHVDSSEGNSDNEPNGIIDDEAEETDNDDGSDGSEDDSNVDYEDSEDDEDDEEEDDESDPEPPPAKRIATKVTRVGGAR